MFQLLCLVTVTTFSTSWQRKTGTAAERAKPPPPPPRRRCGVATPIHWPGGGGVCLSVSVARTRFGSISRAAHARARPRPSSRQGFDVDQSRPPTTPADEEGFLLIGNEMRSPRGGNPTKSGMFFTYFLNPEFLTLKVIVQPCTHW